MSSKRYYEVMLVIEADDLEAGRKAANAAWEAADAVRGASVYDAAAAERLNDGTVGDPAWPDWSEEATVDVRVRYLEW